MRSRSLEAYFVLSCPVLIRSVSIRLVFLLRFLQAWSWCSAAVGVLLGSCQTAFVLLSGNVPDTPREMVSERAGGRVFFWTTTTTGRGWTARERCFPLGESLQAERRYSVLVRPFRPGGGAGCGASYPREGGRQQRPVR